MAEFPAITLGNPDGEVLVFLAGFPDDFLTGFAPLFDDLKRDYFIISTCLPQLGTNTTIPNKKWAYDFHELVPMLHHTITRLTPSCSKTKKINLIIHDWGSIVGMHYENAYPETINKLVVFDVGLIYFPEIRYIFHMAFYQLTFAITYFISQISFVFIGNFFFKCFLLLLYVFPFLGPGIVWCIVYSVYVFPFLGPGIVWCIVWCIVYSICIVYVCTIRIV